MCQWNTLSCTNKPQTLKKKENQKNKTHRKRILFQTFTLLTACSQLKLHVGSNSNKLTYMWEKTNKKKNPKQNTTCTLWQKKSPWFDHWTICLSHANQALKLWPRGNKPNTLKTTIKKMSIQLWLKREKRIPLAGKNNQQQMTYYTVSLFI